MHPTYNLRNFCSLKMNVMRNVSQISWFLILSLLFRWFNFRISLTLSSFPAFLNGFFMVMMVNNYTASVSMHGFAGLSSTRMYNCICCKSLLCKMTHVLQYLVCIILSNVLCCCVLCHGSFSCCTVGLNVFVPSFRWQQF